MTILINRNYIQTTKVYKMFRFTILRNIIIISKHNETIKITIKTTQNAIYKTINKHYQFTCYKTCFRNFRNIINESIFATLKKLIFFHSS